MSLAKPAPEGGRRPPRSRGGPLGSRGSVGAGGSLWPGLPSVTTGIVNLGLELVSYVSLAFLPLFSIAPNHGLNLWFPTDGGWFPPAQ